MMIHIVQSGETIQSIADRYQVSVDRLILENGMPNPNKLVVGQTIVINYPLQSYTIQEGDTLESIAQMFQVPIMQILRNNPYLSDRDYIYTGESIVISYDTEKLGDIVIGGYVSSFVNKDILRKTLPFLTVLTVFDYTINEFGELSTLDDQEIVDITKAYGVFPMILVSTISEKGIVNREIMEALIINKELQSRFIYNVLQVIKGKGYYGLNLYLQLFCVNNKVLVEEFIINISTAIKNEGLRFTITLSPNINIDQSEISYEKIDLSTISGYTDAILILSHEWGYLMGPPAPLAPYNILTQIIENITKTAPSNKIVLGVPVIGYNWKLPYIPGYTRANAITYDNAIQIALENETSIQFNKIAQDPYYYYLSRSDNLQNVWFKDARSIDAISRLVPEYNLMGIAVWNNMFFFTQMWLLINNLFDIVKFLPPTQT